MKKSVIAVVLITGLTLATFASADWGRHGKWGRGCGSCEGRQVVMNPQLDEAGQAKMRQFYKENLTLHKEIAMKQAEKRALMQSDQPDPAAVAKVTGELFELHNALVEKAEIAGVDQFVGQPMRGGQGGPFCSGSGPRRGPNRVN